ncbi:hypothetical protein V8E55_006182 [Tylopilus felleus]
MATVTHVIRSHYDPADREKLEHETGQRTDDQSDPWQTESSFSAQRRIRAAPTFVPATTSYDEWGVPLRTSSATPAPDKRAQPSTSTAEWYKSLTAAASSKAPPPRPSKRTLPALRADGIDSETSPRRHPQARLVYQQSVTLRAVHQAELASTVSGRLARARSTAVALRGSLYPPSLAAHRPVEQGVWYAAAEQGAARASEVDEPIGSQAFS